MEHTALHFRYAFAAVCGLLSLLCFGQQPPVIVWQTSHGGTLDDQCHAIVESDNGGFIVAGVSYSHDFDIVGHHGSPGSPDALVMKYDANGTLLWQRCLGGTGGEVVWDLVATPNGGCVLACSASSTNGDVVGVMGGSDLWLVGLSGSGAILWQRTLGGSASDWRHFMDATADGGMVLLGETQSTDGDVSFNHGVSDLWVVKLDDAGQIEWEHSYGGSLAEYASGIVQNASGGYYVSGSTKSNDGDVSGNHGGVYDAWVFRLDPQGNLLWQKTMGGADRDLFWDICEGHDGGVACIGSSSSVDGDLPGNNGGGDMWVVDLDSSGSVQWNRNYGYLSNDGGRCIKRSAAGGYYLAGSTYGPSGYETGLWMVEVDSVGNTLWEKSIGGSNTSKGIDLIIDSNNDLVVTGWSASEDGDVSDNHGITDAWTVKLTLDYATMTGDMFVDSDSDGLRDASEIGMAGHPVRNVGSGINFFTEQTGAFEVVVMDPGTATITPEPAPYYSSAPQFRTEVFPVLAQQVDSLNHFAMQADGVFDDLAVSLTPVGIFRHLWQTHYTIAYVNLGTTTATSPVLRFAVDQALTYHSASTPPTSINQDTLIWQLPAMAPYEAGTIDVFVSVPLSTPLGTTLSCTAFIDPVSGDADVTNNNASWDVLAIGSADPNDILVDRPEVQYTELSPLPPYLEYLIRFQNTGNDTAFMVRIENAVPVNADLSTFQFLTSSHPVQVEYLQHVDRFTFTFPNILLPDSNVNEAASHGYVRYRTRPRSTLMIGDSVLNTAGIHFDHNAPVITNTAHTVIESSVGVSVGAPAGLTLSPNPGIGGFRVDAGPVRSGLLTILDATGVVVQRSPYRGPQWLDLAHCAPGVYIIQLSVDDRVLTSRLIVAR